MAAGVGGQGGDGNLSGYGDGAWAGGAYSGNATGAAGGFVKQEWADTAVSRMPVAASGGIQQPAFCEFNLASPDDPEVAAGETHIVQY